MIYIGKIQFESVLLTENVLLKEILRSGAEPRLSKFLFLEIRSFFLLRKDRMDWLDASGLAGCLGINSNEIKSSQILDLESLANIGDQFADEFVHQHGKMPPQQVLDKLLEAPPGEESALLKQVRAVPEWVDFDAIERAQRLFWIHHIPITICLFNGSLAGGFAADRMNQVLIKTGHLASSKITKQRVLETAQMILDIMQPNGLDVDNRGWRAVLVTRLIHAQVRLRLRAKITDSVPINQADMLATIGGFQSVVILGLTKFGIRWTHQQREDFTHLWRYVAFLIGVEEEFNILSLGFVPSVAFIKDYIEKCKYLTEKVSWCLIDDSSQK